LTNLQKDRSIIYVRYVLYTCMSGVPLTGSALPLIYPIINLATAVFSQRWPTDVAVERLIHFRPSFYAAIAYLSTEAYLQRGLYL